MALSAESIDVNLISLQTDSDRKEEITFEEQTYLQT